MNLYRFGRGLQITAIFITCVVLLIGSPCLSAEAYIDGPWLWMIAEGANINEDALARASNGAVTEAHVAEHGVREGTTFGDLRWTRGVIPETPQVCVFLNVGCSHNNVNVLVNQIGLSDDANLDAYAAYALINIVSPNRQANVRMGVGSDDSVKVWLNGEVVHVNAINRSTIGISDFFNADLEAGNNLLMVKVSDTGLNWGLFFDIFNADFTTALPSTRPTRQQPDLVVEEVYAEPATVAPGETFKLYATLRNAGAGEAAATIVRYYYVTAAERQLGAGRRDPLAANATITRYLDVTARITPGTYAYQVCVDSVENESNTNNNCSRAVSVTVTASPVVDRNRPMIYWVDRSRKSIKRANLDGSNVKQLTTYAQGLTNPKGIALDVVAGKIYWTDSEWDAASQTTTGKIRRADLDGYNIEDLITLTRLRGTPASIALDVVGGKMYWTDSGWGKIWRANLDGSNVKQLISGGGELDIALDVVGGKMYWTDWNADVIERSNLDGSNVEHLINTRAGIGGWVRPGGIALDVAGGKMYWTIYSSGKIQRANLDGSNIEDLVTGLRGPRRIALDVVGGKMYWTNTNTITGKIQRSNLDGSNIEDLVTQGLSWPYDIALGVAYPVNPRIVREDVNRDGVVDETDVAVVVANLGKTGENRADVNGDGIVDVADLIVVVGAVEDAAAAPSLASAGLFGLTATEVRQLLTEARQRPLTDPVSLRGIAVLEGLLALFTPEETALLANYPNPFNPETWIPYQLATPADVSLKIYDIQGQVVRRLSLGHQAAGFYETRSRAAYWDGRNALGEPVASGVYFYTITAGDFTATRKMLIRK